MQTATLKSKQAARKFVDKLQPVGATNIYDALLTSMDVALKAGRGKEKNPEADTIFFLTDGIPSHGRIVNPHQILEEITKRNELVGLVIHTVGVSKDQNAGFLLNLAKRNGGRYVAHK
jgi:Mg-chelatase subunit ChlD